MLKTRALHIYEVLEIITVSKGKNLVLAAFQIVIPSFRNLINC